MTKPCASDFKQRFYDAVEVIEKTNPPRARRLRKIYNAIAGQDDPSAALDDLKPKFTQNLTKFEKDKRFLFELMYRG